MIDSSIPTLKIRLVRFCGALELGKNNLETTPTINGVLSLAVLDEIGSDELNESRTDCMPLCLPML